MKMTKATLLALITIGGLTACGPMARAADTATDKPDSKPKARQGARPAQRAQDRLKALTEELKLTEDQQTKMKAVFKEQAEKAQALRKDTALSQEDRRAKGKEIREKFNAEVKKILTDEQFQKWEKSRADRQKRARPQQ